MNNAVIVPGKPSKERYENPNLPKPHEANWMRWIGFELENKGIKTYIPAMPEPFFPIQLEWEKAFPTRVVNRTTSVVTHSAGSNFALRWFSEHPGAEAEQLVLVAPYHDEARKYGDFSDYRLDRNLGQRIGKITIFNSLDDSSAIQQNAHRLADQIKGAELVELSGFGHFMIGNAMRGPEFPELLEVLTSEVR